MKLPRGRGKKRVKTKSWRALYKEEHKCLGGRVAKKRKFRGQIKKNFQCAMVKCYRKTKRRVG